MSNSQSTTPQINIGDRVYLSDIVVWPAILQLSRDKSYEVVNVGRANNPLNDLIHVRNDHGRVVGYQARLFKRVEKKYLVFTEQGVFEGVPMIYVNPDGQRIIILALPEYKESLMKNELYGYTLLDESDFHTVGELSAFFGPFFSKI